MNNILTRICIRLPNSNIFKITLQKALYELDNIFIQILSNLDYIDRYDINLKKKIYHVKQLKSRDSQYYIINNNIQLLLNVDKSTDGNIGFIAVKFNLDCIDDYINNVYIEKYNTETRETNKIDFVNYLNMISMSYEFTPDSQNTIKILALIETSNFRTSLYKYYNKGSLKPHQINIYIEDL